MENDFQMRPQSEPMQVKAQNDQEKEQLKNIIEYEESLKCLVSDKTNVCSHLFQR